MMRIRVSGTFVVDFEQLTSLVDLKVTRKAARRAVRDEVRFLMEEACAQLMNVPDFGVEYLAEFLVREDLATFKDPGR